MRGHEIERGEVIQPQGGDQGHVNGPQVPLTAQVADIENPNWVSRY